MLTREACCWTSAAVGSGASSKMTMPRARRLPAIAGHVQCSPKHDPSATQLACLQVATRAGAQAAAVASRLLSEQSTVCSRGADQAEFDCVLRATKWRCLRRAERECERVLSCTHSVASSDLLARRASSSTDTPWAWRYGGSERGASWSG